MQVAAKVGLALGMGAVGGVALGTINERQTTASSFGQIAVGTGAASAASSYILRGPSGIVALGAAMVGSTIAAAGLTQLLRGAPPVPAPPPAFATH